MLNTTATPSHSMPLLSAPRVLLRVEGLAILLAAVVVYIHLAGSGLAFGVFLLAPDLSMLGYLVSLRVGAMMYNIVHTVALPLTLLGVGLALGSTVAVQAALIWAAHIGMDRLVGYGLKYETNFKDTHMGRV